MSCVCVLEESLSSRIILTVGWAKGCNSSCRTHDQVKGYKSKHGDLLRPPLLSCDLELWCSFRQVPGQRTLQNSLSTGGQELVLPLQLLPTPHQSRKLSTCRSCRLCVESRECALHGLSYYSSGTELRCPGVSTRHFLVPHRRVRGSGTAANTCTPHRQARSFTVPAPKLRLISVLEVSTHARTSEARLPSLGGTGQTQVGG